jgi:hypothetical protein
MSVFDDEIGMWAIADEDDEERMVREWENHRIAEKAAEVAELTHVEVGAIEFEARSARPQSPDFKRQSVALLDQIPHLRSQLHLPARRRQPFSWHEPGGEYHAAPWAMLLDPDLPLGTHWEPMDMLRLRCVCSAFRREHSTAQFFAAVLAKFGVTVRAHCTPARECFTLASRIFHELAFIHSCRAVAAKAAGLRADDPAAAHVVHIAGSFALHRYQLHRAPHTPPGWQPGDIDVFVGSFGDGSSARSQRVFRAVLDFASQSCHGLYRHAMMAQDDPNHPFFWMLPLLTTPGSQARRRARQIQVPLEVEPRVRIMRQSDYDALEGAHQEMPPEVAAEMAGPRHTYARALALERAERWPVALVSEVERMPEMLGEERPWAIERVAEVTPNAQTKTLVASCPYRSKWQLPLKINVIQYACRSGRPLPPLSFLAGFDLVNSMVAMRVGADLGVEFEMSDETRATIDRRQLRIGKHAFGPAKDSTREACHRVVDATATRLLERLFKYQGYGFHA